MEKKTSFSLGTLFTILSLLGFIKKRKRLMGMNVDMSHSLLRLPISTLLYYGGAKKSSQPTSRAILLGVGMFYVILGTAGAFDKRIGGLLPSGLSKWDIIYHYTVGGIAIWLGARPDRMMKSHNGDS